MDPRPLQVVPQRALLQLLRSRCRGAALVRSPGTRRGRTGRIIQSSVDASGYQMQRSPEFTGNIGASYGLDLARAG